MAVVVTQEGAQLLWRQILGVSTIGYPWLSLYAAAHTPAHADTLSTYSLLELAVAGYARVSLAAPGTDWSVASIGAGAQAVRLTVSWTFTAACNVYGYYLADSTETYSLWAEQFAAPIVFGSSGGSFSLQLQAWLASYPDVDGIPCTSP